MAGLESEAERRTAVGRLYYGLHHEAACRYFRENPSAPPIPRNRRHTEVRDRFIRSGVPQGRVIGGLLDALSQMRGECDYRLGAPLRYRGTMLTLDKLLDRALAVAAGLRAALDAYSPGESLDGTEYRVTGA